MRLSRREFVAGAAALAPLLGCTLAQKRGRDPLRIGPSPIEHVLVLMQENRSFDHYFGWLTATNQQLYADAHGDHVSTYPLVGDFQGCAYRDPDHSWEGGRQQLAKGFAVGSHDRFAPLSTLPIRTYLAKPADPAGTSSPPPRSRCADSRLSTSE